jgi:glycosyltransferase involved in cell wall biosynthesis
MSTVCDTPTIYADLRGLQTQAFNTRGIGSHIQTLLSWRAHTEARAWRLVGLVDPALASLPPPQAAMCDRIDRCTNPHWEGFRTAYLDCSPLTHEASFGLPLMARPDVLTASLVYDFIPLDWPGYLPAVSKRIRYFSRLARLRRSDLFFPLSQYTARRLRDLLAAPAEAIHVTGVAVRPALLRAAGGVKSSIHLSGWPYFLVAAAEEPRKNPEAPIRASVLLWRQGRHFDLHVLGTYTRAFERRLKDHAGEFSRHVRFVGRVSDEQLAALYAGALATVVPSHIEGFSLPVVEAAACGCPVLASSCDAHLELVTSPKALFRPDREKELAACLDGCLRSPELCEEIAVSQRHLPDRFSEEAVGNRFWTAFIDRMTQPVPVPFVRGRKPRVAFFSPYPPDESGVARYTQITLGAMAERLDIDLYTDASRPLRLPEGVRDAGPISGKPLAARNCDATVFVIGNSQFHVPILDLQERFGGPCILHDSRLTQIYRWKLGETAFLTLAARLLGRRPREREVQNWLADRGPGLLFLEPVLEKARPLIVHTRTLQTIIEQRYSFQPHWAPFNPTVRFHASQLGRVAREEARRRLSVPLDVFLIASFGFAVTTKDPETVIRALGRLRDQGVPAQLHWVGQLDPGLPKIGELVRRLGLLSYVRFREDFVSNETYSDYLLAADAAVQLRTYDLGQASGAMADCAAAGLPAAASEGIAEACDAPAYVARIPAPHSAQTLANALADIWNAGRQPRDNPEWHRYMEEHSPEAYARRVLEVLGYA